MGKKAQRQQKMSRQQEIVTMAKTLSEILLQKNRQSLTRYKEKSTL